MKVRHRREPSEGTADPSGLNSEEVEFPQLLERVDHISCDPLCHFAGAIKAIEYRGPIPHDEQKRIAERTIVAAHSYIFRLAIERKNPSLGKQRQIWKKVVASSGQLLKSLGIDDPADVARGLAGGMPRGRGPLFPIQNLHRIAVERRGSTETMDVGSRFMNMLVVVSDLNEVATCVVRDLDRTAPKVHGGARRTGPGAVAALVHQIIDIYDGVRERHSGSGPPTGYGPPLINFIRACLQVIQPALARNSATTDHMIKAHLRSWRRRKQPMRAG
jgi:hypothetical protein